MASNAFFTKFVEVAGTGSSANLLAAAAGNGYKVWQMVVSNNSATAALVTLTYTLNNTSTTLLVMAPANGSVVLPYSGAPWIVTDINTAITFNNASTLSLNAYYTQD